MSHVYEIDTNSSYGIKSTTPVSCISMPNQVQGMTFTKDGNIMLSTSYSIHASKLLIYENVLNVTPSKTITINNKQIPLYVLNSQNLIKQIIAPPMSEELVLVNNKVYILFESACSKYKLINREKLTHVYSIDI